MRVYVFPSLSLSHTVHAHIYIYTFTYAYSMQIYAYMIIYMHNRDFTSSRAVTQGHPRARGAFHSPIFVKFFLLMDNDKNSTPVT